MQSLCLNLSILAELNIVLFLLCPSPFQFARAEVSARQVVGKIYRGIRQPKYLARTANKLEALTNDFICQNQEGKTL